MNKINIKKTSILDSQIYFKIRNNVSNRKYFANSKYIKKDKHKEWFNKNYSNNHYYTCLYDGQKIGYIRGDKKGDIIEISIGIMNKFRGRNIASKCFKLFEKKFKFNTIFLAKVKINNKKSILFFENNKFNFLKKEKQYFTFFKVHHNKFQKYLTTIDEIEKIRSGNNINWMNILRVAFMNSPSETSKIFKRIFKDDNSINKLSKKLF